jgi:U3 small nucleolar RNA-associated protein 23
MPLQKYLSNTLHGECKIFVTQCTLAKIMKEHEKATNGKGRGRPAFLPPPMDLPLRYCKHKNDKGEEVGVVDEWRCLLDLLAGQPKGNEQAKNKQHYCLATAEPPEKETRRKGFVDVRERAKLIPGVPTVYVQKSVMTLDKLSLASEVAQRGAEKEKIREGLLDTRKRKRDDGDGEDEVIKELMADERQQVPAKRGLLKARGPNPLSVPKKKVKIVKGDTGRDGDVEDAERSKAARRGKRGKKKADINPDEDGAEDRIIEEVSAIADDD